MSTNRRRRNRVKQQDKPDARFGDSLLSKILWVVIVVAMLGTLGVLVWQRSTQPLDTRDYEGRIVDRWANYAESEEGSRPRFFLVVDDAQSRRFTVRVDPTTYESARVGMRIKRESGKIVLIDSDKTQR